MYMLKPNDRNIGEFIGESICILLKRFSKVCYFSLKVYFCLGNTIVFPIVVKSYIYIVNKCLNYFNFFTYATTKNSRQQHKEKLSGTLRNFLKYKVFLRFKSLEIDELE